MPQDIDQELAQLQQMTVAELRACYQQVVGEPSRSAHKQHLIRRIAWRLQALAEGDLSERAQRRATELAQDADLRLRAPRGQDPRPPQSGDRPQDTPPRRDGRLPSPGTILVRAYRGRTCQVQVREQGFEYEGRLYASLTAVTRQITGQHWNGYHFFALTEETPGS